MSKIILYGMDLSPPVRTCLLTLNALELEFEYKIVNLFQGEHLTEDFLKHNPQHTVPVLDDDGTWLYDSHAICAYLVDKYGKSDILYPKDLAQRALVNQRMFFEATMLYMPMRNISKPLFVDKISKVPKEKTQNVIQGYALMETFLAESPYITGENITIADFCCLSTLTSSKGVIPIDQEKFPKLTAWIERLSKLPYYEKSNKKGAKDYIEMVKSGLTEIEM